MGGDRAPRTTASALAPRDTDQQALVELDVGDDRGETAPDPLRPEDDARGPLSLERGHPRHLRLIRLGEGEALERSLHRSHIGVAGVSALCCIRPVDGARRYAPCRDAWTRSARANRIRVARERGEVDRPWATGLTGELGFLRRHDPDGEQD